MQCIYSLNKRQGNHFYVNIKASVPWTQATLDIELNDANNDISSHMLAQCNHKEKSHQCHSADIDLARTIFKTNICIN